MPSDPMTAVIQQPPVLLHKNQMLRKEILIILSLVQASAQVTTSQYDNARTGADLNETILTPRNVNARQFGKIFTLSVDGDVYTQPLYLAGLDIPGKGKHNVLFFATEHNSVYAFDADTSAPPLWQASFVNPSAGITTVPDRDVRCPFISPEVGITPTPVIDAATGTLYVLARTKESGHYYQRLHALDVTSGAEKFGGPVAIQAAVKDNGYFGGHFAGDVVFSQLRELPRAGLLLVNGKVYLSWGSSCDVGPYHGWIMAYDARTLKQTAVFNTSPDSSESGIWQGDAAIAADAAGNVFAVTGNGKFDAGTGGRDYGDTVLKLGLTNGGLVVRDYFTPSNQQYLNSEDLDVGSTGPVLLPDQPGGHPHVLVVAGKEGRIYVVDRDRMGKFQPGADPHAIQTIPRGAGTGAFGAPAYWNGHVYWLGSKDVLKDWAVDHGRLSARPVAAASTVFTDPGATPTVSANQSRDGIVWVVQTKTWNAFRSGLPAILRAYDAADVSRELYNSAQLASRDVAGSALRFVIPTVANARVYIGTQREVDVYGLLAPPTQQKVRVTSAPARSAGTRKRGNP